MSESSASQRRGGGIGLSSYLSRRLLPVTIGGGLLIALVFPTTYFRLEHRRLEQQARMFAETLANKFTSQLVLHAPSLWKYQTYKHTQIIEDLVSNSDIASIRVYDENGKEIDGYHYVHPDLKWWEMHVLWGSGPIRFNNRQIGTVQIGVSEGRIVLEALVLLLVSVVVGVSFGVAGYLFPVSVVRKMEADINGLIDSVRAANMESERLRVVAENSARELEEAYEELKESESKIMQHEKLVSIGHLAAGVAHEVNNPLAFISSNLNVLQDYAGWLRSYVNLQDRVVTDIADPPTVETVTEARRRLNIEFILSDLDQLIAQSLDGTDRVRKIVQELKGFAMSDEEMRLSNINECLDSTVRLVHNQLSRKADIVTEYGDVPETRCYPQQLNQVFMNLLINAGHAIAGHGTITVRSFCRDGSIFISVADTGCGIPPDIQAKIFEPFFTTRERGQGTGLGLSISSGIIKNHGGEISLQSVPGAGSTFTVRIPITASAE